MVVSWHGFTSRSPDLHAISPVFGSSNPNLVGVHGWLPIFLNVITHLYCDGRSGPLDVFCEVIRLYASAKNVLILVTKSDAAIRYICSCSMLPSASFTSMLS